MVIFRFVLVHFQWPKEKNDWRRATSLSTSKRKNRFISLRFAHKIGNALLKSTTKHTFLNRAYCFWARAQSHLDSRAHEYVCVCRLPLIPTRWDDVMVRARTLHFNLSVSPFHTNRWDCTDQYIHTRANNPKTNQMVLQYAAIGIASFIRSLSLPSHARETEREQSARHA